MIKYSGNYSNINPNFVIGNINEYKNETDFNGLFCIAKNIFTRDCPIRLSPFLSEKYDYKKIDYFKYSFDNLSLSFDKIIKTGDGSDNPALIFYKTFLENTHNKNIYFLPECLRKDIIYNDNISDDSSVDFYSPHLKTIIEIDGMQHLNVANKKIDYNRDYEFSNHGINVIRIKTQEIRSGDFIKRIISYVDKWNKNILDSNFNFINRADLKKNEIVLTFIYRLQILLLELFKNNYLKIDSKELVFDIKTDASINEKDCDNAWEDLCIFLKNLFALNNYKINLPIVRFNLVKDFSFNNNFKLNINVFKLYDEKVFFKDDIFYVFNDYFPYSKKNHNDSLNYFSTFKNYYKVECHNFRFNNVDEKNEEHVNALNYFLKIIYSYDEYRPKQLEIITHGLSSKNGVIGLLPTSSGKSLCYQMISFLTPGITLVITPLKILMEDQCVDLEKYGFRHAYFINSSNNSDVINEKNSSKVLRFLKEDGVKILYISPERFFNKEFLNIIKKNNNKICQIAIDEVHCVSEWGHDFRTSYLLLFEFIKRLTNKNMLLIGTSATASPRVTNDIYVEFNKIKKTIILVKTTSVKRPELTFKVIFVSNDEEKNATLKRIVEENHILHKKTIIFDAFKKTVDNNLIYLGQIPDLKIQKFYSDLDEKEMTKSEILNEFKNNILECVVSTKAFGMGVNIPDIRATIHNEFSSSVESIYQEMGRAGRDGLKSECIIIYDKSKEKNIEELFSQEEIDFDNFTKQKGFYGGLDNQFFLIEKNTIKPENEKYIIAFILNFILEKNLQEINTFSLDEVIDYLSKKFTEKNKISLLDNFKINNKSNNDSKFLSVSFSSFFEKCLYKLNVLGILNLWEIDYKDRIDNPIYTNISVNWKKGQDTKIVYNHLIDYIRKYEPKYDVSDLIKNNHEHKVSNYIFELCKWNHEHFFMSRWSSLKNLHDYVVNFKNSEEFATRIDNYFVESEILNDAKNNQDTYRLWFDAIKSDTPEALKDRLSRIIEDEADSNLAINYISSIIRLKTNDFNSRDGSYRLKLALDEIIKSNLNIEDILNNTFEILLDDEKRTLIDFIIEYFTDINMYDKISFLFTNEEYSMLILYNDLKKLKNGLVGVSDGTRIK